MHVHTYETTLSLKEDSEPALTSTSTVTISNEIEINLNVDVPPSATPSPVFGLSPYTDLKSLYMLSDQDIEVETDGNDTFNLTADEPYYWHTSLGTSNPLTSDIESVTLTPAAGVNVITNVIIKMIRSQ